MGALLGPLQHCSRLCVSMSVRAYSPAPTLPMGQAHTPRISAPPPSPPLPLVAMETHLEQAPQRGAYSSSFRPLLSSFCCTLSFSRRLCCSLPVHPIIPSSLSPIPLHGASLPSSSLSFAVPSLAVSPISRLAWFTASTPRGTEHTHFTALSHTRARSYSWGWSGLTGAGKASNGGQIPKRLRAAIHRERREEAVRAGHPKESPAWTKKGLRDVCMCVVCKCLREISPTQTKELIYVLLHAAGVCDEASVSVCVCVCWCDGYDATWSFSSRQLAERAREVGNERMRLRGSVSNEDVFV